jgi:hypothetical protein
MNDQSPGKNWKLDLRYGRMTTPFKHFTAIADGVVGDLVEGFECPPGTAFMAMKCWASSTDESADMIQSIGEQIGFKVTGKIEVFVTEPEQPPGNNPHGYDIGFTPYSP